jgi:hypothetical protein
MPSRQTVVIVLVVLVLSIVSLVAGIKIWGEDGTGKCIARKARNPGFVISAKQDYRIELGRGSAWNGLNTISIMRDKKVRVVRLRKELGDASVIHRWEETELEMSGEKKAEIVNAINRFKILGLERAYVDKNIVDGDQWVLWVSQGKKSEAFYFDNCFPEAVRKFGNFVDAKIEEKGIEERRWKNIPDGLKREHEKAIWGSVEDVIKEINKKAKSSKERGGR